MTTVRDDGATAGAAGAAVMERAYAEGWDFACRSVVRPLTREEARGRDAAGLPYAVVYQPEGGTHPAEVHLISWRDHYAAVWEYDRQGRRWRLHERRLLDGDQLLRHHTHAWHYPDPEAPELGRECPQTVLRLEPGGRGELADYPRGDKGGSHHTRPDVAEEDRWFPRPGFDDWAGDLAERAEDGRPPVLHEASGTAPADTSSTVTLPGPADPWLPPRPMEPEPFEDLFRAGTRLSTSEYGGYMTVLEPRTDATVRVPSGLLAVSCPGFAKDRPQITVPVEPGTYPVRGARIRRTYEFWGEQQQSTDVVALKVVLADEPVVRWEAAAGEGMDSRLLRDGEAYGFDTDGALGAFADAGSWAVLAERFRARPHDGDVTAGEDVDPDTGFFARTVDAEAGADLLAFCTGGDGTYPVWLGRGEDGETVCVAVAVDYLPELKVLGSGE